LGDMETHVDNGTFNPIPILCILSKRTQVQNVTDGNGA
jgi:hypothetical protein